VGAAAVLFGFRQQIADLVYRETVESGSRGIFLGATPQADLETLVAVRRTVFPHDFFLPDTSVYSLLADVARADRPAEEALTTAEYRHLQAANLAAEVGLATRDGDPGYVVVTNVIRLGYRLGELESAMTERHGTAPSVDGTQIAVRLPTATVLSVETEDLQRERYPYSAVYLSPEQWRAVAEFVAPAVAGSSWTDQLRGRATVRGVELLQYLSGGSNSPVLFHP
jgi:hypothetical protein